MRRLLSMCAAAVLAASALSTLSTGPAFADEPACVTSADATFTASLDQAAGTATVSSDKPLCEGSRASFSLSSYTAPAATAASYPRYLYGVDSYKWIEAGATSVSLKTDVPGCFHGLAVVRGNSPVKIISSAAEENTGVLASAVGGDRACAPAPKIEFVSSCDNRFTANLSNGAGAPIDAVFFISGLKYGTTAVRVAAGTTTAFPHPQFGSHFTIRDNAGGLTEADYRKPATCTTPAPTPTVTAKPTATTTAKPTMAPTSSAAPTTGAPAGGSGGGATPTVATTPVAASSGDLPTTGTNVLGIAGVAGGLLVIGAILLLVTRRRA